MTNDMSQFAMLKLKSKGYVTYDDNNHGRFLGRRDIRTKLSTIIKDVLYVQGVKHNLLNISQPCDKGYKVKFESKNYKIYNEDTCMAIFTGKKFKNIYLLNIHHNTSMNECLISKDDES